MFFASQKDNLYLDISWKRTYRELPVHVVFIPGNGWINLDEDETISSDEKDKLLADNIHHRECLLLSDYYKIKNGRCNIKSHPIKTPIFPTFNQRTHALKEIKNGQEKRLATLMKYYQEALHNKDKELVEYIIPYLKLLCNVKKHNFEKRIEFLMNLYAPVLQKLVDYDKEYKNIKRVDYEME